MNRPTIFRWGALAVALLVVPSAARADWMTQYSGYSLFRNDTLGNPVNGAAGLVNFAVYDNSVNTIDWTSLVPGNNAYNFLGTTQGLAGVDKTAKYIYFYQVVNTEGVNGITQLQVNAGAGVTSAGGLQPSTGTDGYVFKDLVKDNGGGPGPFEVGVTNGNDKDAYLGPGNGTDSDVTLNGILSNAGNIANINSGGLGFTINTGNGQTAANFVLNASGSVLFSFADLQGGKHTVVLFITSNNAPTIGGASIIDGQLATTNDVPLGSSGVIIQSDVPEPATLAMMAIGLPLAGVGYVRRIRKAKAEAAA